MLLETSAEIQDIKKSIRYETQHLMQINELLFNFENLNSKFKKWLLVILPIVVTLCKNIQILICSPPQMKFLHLLSKFHGYIFNCLGET